MYSHADNDYKCPICIGVQGIENDDTLLKADDVVYKDDVVTAFINSFFIGKNSGHVIVVPNKHIENLYDLDATTAQQIVMVSQKIALAMKRAYKCDGITVQQNNEPAGGQHAFHYHMHVFPRYDNDDIYQHMTNKQLADPEIRKRYADKLKAAL